jgi:hypothetical protein
MPAMWRFTDGSRLASLRRCERLVRKSVYRFTGGEEIEASETALAVT